MRSSSSRLSAGTALIALACAWALGGCGGSDDSGASDQPKTVASSGRGGSGEGAEAGKTQSRSGDGSRNEGSGDQAAGGSQPPSGSNPTAPGANGEDEQLPAQPVRHPKGATKPHKPHPGGKSPANSTAGLSPQEAAAFETARALCANPDSLQHAPEEIRDDAEALAEFAEHFAPPGEKQIVHDGCLVGLKSIGIN